MKETITEIKEEGISSLLDIIKSILETKILTLGESDLTIGLLLSLIISIVLLFIVAGWIKKLLVYKILSRYNIGMGTRQSVGAIVKYILIIAGLFSILQTKGIDLSAFGILVGALGVGIGFGLQNITNNFISGLIILFEQPIKIGDRIEVGDISGDVIKIAARSTTIITNDNISVIIPNSQFIDNQVINWSHNDRNIRFNIPVGVSYKENPLKIREILVDVANKNKGVSKSPPPDVLFDAFDDSSLNFNLRIWTTEYINRPNVLKSQLYYEIFQRFAEEGIEIPYPQRDIHIISGTDKLKK